MQTLVIFCICVVIVAYVFGILWHELVHNPSKDFVDDIHRSVGPPDAPNTTPIIPLYPNPENHV